METVQLQYAIDTLFLIFASVLIILMVPGFAMLEAGLVRTKNVVAVLTGNVMLYAITSFIFLPIFFESAVTLISINVYGVSLLNLSI